MQRSGVHSVGLLEGIAPRLQPALKDPKFTLIPDKFGFATFKWNIVQLGKVQFRRCGGCLWALEISLE